jgi:hypothetical protein
MKPIDFPETTLVIAKNQPQYLPLPSYRYERDDEGRVVFCWKLTWAERFAVLFGGLLWHQVLTFNRPLQPTLLSVDKPVMPPHENLSL